MFIDFIKKSFPGGVWAVDSEFRLDPSKTIPDHVVCFVYKNIFTGETLRFWEDDKKFSQRHLDYDDCLLVCYMATAEVGCYLKILHGYPNNLWDCYIENARLYKPFRTEPGSLSLVSTANFYGCSNVMGKDEKEETRNLIINNTTYSLQQQKEILDYCQRDVEMLQQVFLKQVSDIENKMKLQPESYEDELQNIMRRGFSMGCSAKVEKNGIPVDAELVNEINYHLPLIKDKLIEKYDKELEVFENGKFSNLKFAKLIERLGLKYKWPRLKTGAYSADKKTIKRFIDVPEIKKFHHIKQFLNMTRLTNYVPCSDGRVRTSLFMFGTITGRTTPSTAKYPFNSSKWFRNVIKPSWGNYLVYADYKSQEAGVQAYLSGDKNLIEAYQSGDIYIHTAKMFGMIPMHIPATKKTHPKTRDIFKVLFLATGYGAGAPWVSMKLKIPLPKAKELLLKFKDTYKTYFNYIESLINGACATKYLSTEFGWQRWIKSFVAKMKDGKRGNVARSLLNWPIQSNGAEILRRALCDLTVRQFEVCALVHDAVLVQIPRNDFDQRLKELVTVMENASRIVVGGTIRVDTNIIRGNYKQDEEDQKLFDDLMNEIKEYKATTIQGATSLKPTYSQPDSTSI